MTQKVHVMIVPTSAVTRQCFFTAEFSYIPSPRLSRAPMDLNVFPTAWCVATGVTAWTTRTRSSEASCARRVLPMVTIDCLCRISLDLLVAEGSPVSSQGRVTVAVVVLPLTAALHPLLYMYGVLRERIQRARHERLLKYLMARRRAKALNV